MQASDNPRKAGQVLAADDRDQIAGGVVRTAEGDARRDIGGVGEVRRRRVGAGVDPRGLHNRAPGVN